MPIRSCSPVRSGPIPTCVPPRWLPRSSTSEITPRGLIRPRLRAIHRSPTLRQTIKRLQPTTSDASTQLTNLKVPIGWCSGSAASGSTLQQVTSEPDADGDASEHTEVPCTPDRQLPSNGSAWLLKISGLLITMIALSQGAPFWFDLLKKLVNLRLAGDAPDEKKK